MRKRELGHSGIEASVVGLGAWAIGGWMWGGTNESDSIRAIHAAIDAGVDLIDTAPIYGFGRSEQIVGKAIRGRRDRVVLATKCSMVCNPTVGELKFRSDAAGPNPDGHITIHIYSGPDSIRQELEASLRRLGTDHVDLYQTHWQDSTTPIQDTMGALLELKAGGKIRAIGVCNAASSHMDEYRKVGQLDSDQEQFSMIHRGIEGDQLPYCREHGLAVLAYSPLARGLLTGQVGPDREFAEGDLRRGAPRFSSENRRRIAEMLDEFHPVLEGRQITPAQLAIAWAVHRPGLTHALVGARNPEQAAENAAAGNVELTEHELKLVDQAIDRYVAAVA